jgi:hypothetical protein
MQLVSSLYFAHISLLEDKAINPVEPYIQSQFIPRMHIGAVQSVPRVNEQSAGCSLAAVWVNISLYNCFNL